MIRVARVRWRRARTVLAAGGAARGQVRERDALIVAIEGSAAGLGEAAPLPGRSRDTLAEADRVMHELAARAAFSVEDGAHASAIARELAERAPAARFAIETALAAALAQHARTSVAAMWRATHAAAIETAIVVDDDHSAHGARWLKVKLGDAPFADDRARLVRIARAAPRARLRLDVNRRWPRSETAARLAALADTRELHGAIDFVEEPCPLAHELLGESLALPLALDETVAELDADELARALRSPHLAALILKPTILGGFARCLELADAAQRAGRAAIVSHALEGAIGLAACGELARAIGGSVAHGVAPHRSVEVAR